MVESRVSRDEAGRSGGHGSESNGYWGSDGRVGGTSTADRTGRRVPDFDDSLEPTR